MPIPSRSRVRSELFRTFRKLDPQSLGVHDPKLGEGDVALESREGRVDLAFGIYSEEGLRKALEAYGSIKKLEERGVGTIEVKLNLEDPFRPNIQLHSREFKKPVVDITLTKQPGRAVGLDGTNADAPLLYLESVTLQHPGKRFEWSRPPLPGQEFPGLSLSGEILQLLLLVAYRIGAKAMALTPSSFHAARIYERHFQFLDGGAEGTFRALRQAGELRPLWLLAWAIELGCVKEHGREFHWTPSPMLAPLDEELERLFTREPYEDACLASSARQFEIDFELLKARFPWDRMPNSKPPALIAALLK